LERPCRDSAANGNPIRYLCSILSTGESRRRCLLIAPGAEAARELNPGVMWVINANG
jgi:hypothetical protein